MERYDFMKALTKQITDSKARLEIAKEMHDHIEDQKEAYLMEGMSENEAECEALRQMGDPVEIGTQFGALYNMNTERRNMLFYAVFVVLGAVLTWMLGKYYYFWEDPALNIVMTVVGYLLLLYGFLSGVEEKVWDMPFFYGKSQSAGTNLNSYGVCVIGAILVAKDLGKFLILSLLAGAILYLERQLVERKHEEKMEQFMWKSGVAVTDIDYKGKAEIDGKVWKVRVRHDKIEKGNPLVIVNVEGLFLIAELEKAWE